jgi:fumarate hydratase class II
MERGLRRLRHAQEELQEVALGGTAVGTGINAHPEFAQRVAARVSELAGVTIRESSNHFQAQNTLDGISEASGSLRTVAISLLKIANDIRWMASGPRSGIQEIELPTVQPGSSIMPGKINPVIPESVAQVAAQVVGNDASIVIAAQSGNFELNVMMPVAAHNLLESIELLATSAANFAEQAIKGLKATEQGPAMVEKGIMLATALAPVIGYDAAADLAKEAFKTGRTVRELARERTSLTEEQLSEILDPARMVVPGLTGGPGGG